MTDEQKPAALAVAAVGRRIVGATRSADTAVIEAAQTIALFVSERAEKRLKIDIGIEALAQVHQALGSALQTRAAFIEARLSLVKLPKQLGVEGYGPTCICDDPDRKVNGDRNTTVAPIRAAA